MACSQQVRRASNLVDTLRSLLYIGPISESDFFVWEALINGPKDTPFVRSMPPFPVLSTESYQEGGVFAAKLTFVRLLSYIYPNSVLTSSYSPLIIHSRRSR